MRGCFNNVVYFSRQVLSRYEYSPRLQTQLLLPINFSDRGKNLASLGDFVLDFLQEPLASAGYLLLQVRQVQVKVRF